MGMSVHMWGRENMGDLYLLTFVVNLKLLLKKKSLFSLSDKDRGGGEGGRTCKIDVSKDRQNNSYNLRKLFLKYFKLQIERIYCIPCKFNPGFKPNIRTS